MSLELPRGQVFGTWDAPATDFNDPIPTPVGETCIWCRERIEEGDNGRITPVGQVEHRECSLRGVIGGIGHLVDHERYCTRMGNPNAGLSHRQSALMVWEFFQDTRGSFVPGWETLEKWRNLVEEARQSGTLV